MTTPSRLRRATEKNTTSAEGGLDARGCPALFNLVIRGHGYRDGNILRADPNPLIDYVTDKLRWGRNVIRFIGCEGPYVWRSKREI